MAVEVAYKYASSSDTNELYLEQIEDGGAHYAGERTAIVIIQEGLQVALNLRGGNFLLRFALDCKVEAQLRAPVLHFDAKCSHKERMREN